MSKQITNPKMNLHDLAGRKITMVQYLQTNYFKEKVRGKIPTAKYLLNFNVEIENPNGSATQFLVLDPYGACDSGMPHELLRHTEVQGCDILVNRDTREVYPCDFYLQGREVNMGVHSKMWQVPRRYRTRLNELLTKKRPYWFLFDPGVIHSVATGYYGHERLADALVLALDFDDVIVELAQDGTYRTTTAWKQG